MPHRRDRGPSLGRQHREDQEEEKEREREKREEEQRERETASVTPRTGRKTGTSVTEGTSRSITGWIGSRASART
jgi:hypothetical protein